MPLDPLEFRRVMGTFATGVTVITMPTRDGAWGMTANSITSVSLEPTLVLVSVDKATRTYQHIQASGVWAVNILAATQEAISRTFALKDIEEERTMVGTPYHLGATGAPIIEGSLSYLDCRTWATYDGGDHTLFLGEVQDAAVVDPDSPPLRSRIEAAAPADAELSFPRSAAEFEAQLDPAPDLILVGMAATRLPWPDLIRAARANPASREVRVLAFGPHKNLELRSRALEAGADRVMANSALMLALPRLLRGEPPEDDS